MKVTPLAQEALLGAESGGELDGSGFAKQGDFDSETSFEDEEAEQ